jgi:DNA primase
MMRIRRIVNFKEVCTEINMHFLWELAPFFPNIDLLSLKKGSKARILCPLHKEKTPSFHFSPEARLCFCWGCAGVGGTVLDFYCKLKNTDLFTAVIRLAKFFNITLVWESKIQRKKKEAFRKEDPDNNLTFVKEAEDWDDIPF